MQAVYEQPVSHKTAGQKGKENLATCHLQNKKPIMSDITLKSKLPVLSKTKPPPDFHKMHQAWQNQFLKGKAVSKKSCTRPQPFNFSQKGDEFRVAAASDTRLSAALSSSDRSGCTNREPLAEVCLGQKNLGKDTLHSKDVPELEFKVDTAALASILSNVGVTTVPGGLSGKMSLAQRVPMKISSNAASMARSSLYTPFGNQMKCTNVNRMSCFPRLTTKGQEQRTLSRQKPEVASQPPDIILKKCPSKDDCIQSQVNPVLQQMNPLIHIFATGDHSFPVGQPEILTSNQSSANPIDKDLKPGSTDTVWEDALTRQRPQISLAQSDIIKDNNKEMTDPFGGFVEDPQALASIISNTGVTATYGGKLSLAQRVPVQGKHTAVKNSMVFSGSAVGQGMTPNPLFGRMSTMSLKSIIPFSPCRVPQSTQTPNSLSAIPARRIQNLKSSGTKFSQNFSFNTKEPVFPKTPKAIAVEMANKRFEADFPEPQTSTKSSVKWADQPSPAVPEAFCENESNLEQVAVRLFADSDCKGNADKEMEMPVCMLNNLQYSELCKKDKVVPKETAESNRSAHPPPLTLHQQLAPLSIQEPCSTFSVPSSRIVQEVKTSLPLSFLSHPAVQALKSGSYGPLSLPHIAQMRLQATMSAKARFWDTCLDDECAFYTSLGRFGCARSCVDPVASSLEKQENMHFIPISPEEFVPSSSDGSEYSLATQK